jgi:hypothetical protein
MLIFKRSKSEDKMIEGLGTRESPRVVTPKQLVERGLNYLSEEEAVELFKEHFGEKYIIKKTKRYKCEGGNGRGWRSGRKRREME